MLKVDSKKEKNKDKESLVSRKKESTLKPLADLIKEINKMSKKANNKTENSWQPEPPLAA